MARKHKCPPAGAPEWVVTYGDMMSLLLTFFILLAALSELKKEEQYQAITRSVQRSFGMDKGWNGRELKPEQPISSIMPQVDDEKRQRKQPNRSQAPDQGVDGVNREVTRVREGMIFTVGGRILFSPGSATLTDENRAALRGLAEEIRGRKNKVEIRGHASPMERSLALANRQDLWTLSYARAKAVLDYMTGDEVALPPDLFRVMASADSEPMVARVYTQDDQGLNRRVEVLVSEALTDDLTHPETVKP